MNGHSCTARFCSTAQRSQCLAQQELQRPLKARNLEVLVSCWDTGTVCKIIKGRLGCATQPLPALTSCWGGLKRHVSCSHRSGVLMPGLATTFEHCCWQHPVLNNALLPAWKSACGVVKVTTADHGDFQPCFRANTGLHLHSLLLSLNFTTTASLGPVLLQLHVADAHCACI